LEVNILGALQTIWFQLLNVFNILIANKGSYIVNVPRNRQKLEMRNFLEAQYQLPPNAVSCGQNPTIAYQAATAKVLIGNSIRGISLDNILQ